MNELIQIFENMLRRIIKEKISKALLTFTVDHNATHLEP